MVFQYMETSVLTEAMFYLSVCAYFKHSGVFGVCLATSMLENEFGRRKIVVFYHIAF